MTGLIWRLDGGKWAMAQGQGRYADETALDGFAESLRATPQPVGIGLTVAPRGWAPARWKSPGLVTYPPMGSPATPRSRCSGRRSWSR